MSAPEMLVVAGPAGSGKTTAFPPRGFGTDFFSVDDRCAELNGVEQHIADGVSFAVETTLRTDAAIRQAEAANAAGFSTFLFFLGTEDVRLNIDRIATRGWMGGHSSPEADIRAIFEASMANLPRAVAVFSHVDCFDTSRSSADPVRVLAFDRGRVVYRADPLPAWAAALVSADAPE